MATSLEDWAGQVLDRYSVLTGHPLAHDWQIAHSPLEPGKRLVPTVPFVIGGDYVVDNLRAVDAEESMRLRAELALQIRHIPEGAEIRIRFTN